MTYGYYKMRMNMARRGCKNHAGVSKKHANATYLTMFGP